MYCRELKAAKEKLRKLQELVMRIQQGAGVDALMELESVLSTAESVDAPPAATTAAAAAAADTNRLVLPTVLVREVMQLPFLVCPFVRPSICFHCIGPTN